MDKSSKKQATFWKFTVIILGIISLSTGLIKSKGFWTSYALDIAGPAWIYILVRVQYSTNKSSFLSIKFSPEAAGILILGICLIIETSQYFEIYYAHFDPYDYIAYFSALFPIYIIDKWLIKRNLKRR